MDFKHEDIKAKFYPEKMVLGINDNNKYLNRSFHFNIFTTNETNKFSVELTVVILQELNMFCSQKSESIFIIKDKNSPLTIPEAKYLIKLSCIKGLRFIERKISDQLVFDLTFSDPTDDELNEMKKIGPHDN